MNALDLRTVGEPLLGKIFKYGVRLVGRDDVYGDLIRRQVFDQEDFMPYRRRILEERRKMWIGK